MKKLFVFFIFISVTVLSYAQADTKKNSIIKSNVSTNLENDNSRIKATELQQKSNIKRFTTSDDELKSKQKTNATPNQVKPTLRNRSINDKPTSIINRNISTDASAPIREKPDNIKRAKHNNQ